MKTIALSQRDYWTYFLGKLYVAKIAEEPVNTERAAGILRRRGLAATADKLKTMVRRGLLPEVGTGPHAAWTPERIDAAANYLESRGDYTEEAAFYASKGLSMADVYQALWDAYNAILEQYGQAAGKEFGTTPNIDYFTMTITPEWDQRPAKVSFDLLHEVRREIEQAAKARR